MEEKQVENQMNPDRKITQWSRDFWKWREREEGTGGKGLALLCCSFISAFLFSVLILKGGRGIAVPIFILSFYLCYFWFFQDRKNAFSGKSLLLFSAILLISCCYLFVDSPFVHSINFCTLAVLVPMHFIYLSSQQRKNLFSMETIAVTIELVFGKTFFHLSAAPRLLSAAKEGKERKGFRLLSILFGLAAAFPFVAIFIYLFSKADVVFRNWVQQVVQSLHLNFGNVLFHLFFTLVFTFLFTSFILALRIDAPTEESDLFSKPKKISRVASSAFLLPILGIESVYIAAQSRFFFGGVLPAGYSYASYVHNGFGQSAAAALLTAAIILLVYAVCERDSKGVLPIGIRIILSLLITCNLFAFASTIIRLILYIRVYDLTILRIAVGWLICLMSLILVILLLKLWAPRVNAAAMVGTSVVLMVLVLNLLHPDVLSAKVNISRYLEEYQTNSQTASIDLNYLSRLSNAVLPEIEELTTTADPEISQQAVHLLCNWEEQHRKMSWKTFCVTDLEAKRILERWEPSTARLS